MDLCGHATIGSFKALLEGGYIEDNSSYINHTLAGDLNIDVKDGFVLMDMAAPVKIAEIADNAGLDELYRIMGLDYADQKAKGVNCSGGCPSPCSCCSCMVCLFLQVGGYRRPRFYSRC